MLSMGQNACIEPIPGDSFDSGAVMLEPEEGAARLENYRAEFRTREEWEARARRVRASMRKGAELEPWPFLGTPRTVLHSRRVYRDYCVENVLLESFPGFYITGNLYRPLRRTAPFPGILINMGHFDRGRHEADHQLFAATLARMGAVVFLYDMLGHGESHQPRKTEPAHDHDFPKAAKLELLDALRSLDFLVSLEGVDPERVGVTGASGGGSRTLFLTALDARVKASAPLIMVSDFFYGGCVCESGMPIVYRAEVDTVLADVAALAAPRPMLVVSDGKDWTRTVPTSEFPYIQSVYDLYGAGDAATCVHLPDETHDLGPNKRKAVYGFFASVFELSPFESESGSVVEEWSLQKVVTAAHPLPPDALIGEAAILDALEKISFR